ncbi:putative periplasmic lipoprotein [Pseudocitrobacter cyperus]|uniref:PEGA domain-containing protein n=1 Tax=Pseudocitrobacter cyperus TaxID=3112843 RepID=A0ABV0HLQ7_9ENTR
MKKLLTVLLLPFFLTGCATIFGSGEETVYINSTPDNAFFAIVDNNGQVVASGVTPQAVVLKKADGSYFGKRSYTLTLKQPGYYAERMPLTYRFSYWYTFGNLILLGVPGWFIVDPFNGGMYTFKEDRIQPILRHCPRGPFNYMCS